VASRGVTVCFSSAHAVSAFRLFPNSTGSAPVTLVSVAALQRSQPSTT
jgi:hypothetical protein